MWLILPEPDWYTPRPDIRKVHDDVMTWWRYQMETFSALLAICAGNSPVTGEFPAQRPATWTFDVFFDLRPNKRLSKQSWGWWFEMPSRPLWRHWRGNTFSALLSLCERNPRFIGGSPHKGTIMWIFDVSFAASLNTSLNKQSISRWFETF